MTSAHEQTLLTGPLPSLDTLGELSVILAEPGTVSLTGAVERAWIWLNTWITYALPPPGPIRDLRRYLRDSFDWPLLLACAQAEHDSAFTALIFCAGLSDTEAETLTDTPQAREHLTTLAALRGYV